MITTVAVVVSAEVTTAVASSSALLTHPVASTSALTGVSRIALTGSAQSEVVPSSWRGKFVKLSVEGANGVQFAFSAGAAVTLVRDQTGTLNSPSAVAGTPIPAGSFADGRVPVGATHLNWISTSASSGGFLVAHVSETQV